MKTNVSLFLKLNFLNNWHIRAATKINKKFTSKLGFSVENIFFKKSFINV